MKKSRYYNDIWKILVNNTIDISKYEIDFEDIKPNTNTKNIFPTHLSENEFKDENADRFGVLIAKTIKDVEKELGVKINVGFGVREEFEIFKCFNDIAKYIEFKIGGEGI